VTKVLPAGRLAVPPQQWDSLDAFIGLISAPVTARRGYSSTRRVANAEYGRIGTVVITFAIANSGSLVRIAATLTKQEPSRRELIFRNFSHKSRDTEKSSAVDVVLLGGRTGGRNFSRIGVPRASGRACRQRSFGAEPLKPDVKPGVC